MEITKIKTRRGHWITASVFRQNSNLVLIISPAAGVKQSFYYAFAEFLNAHGIIIVTFDFYGIGESLDGSIQQVSINAAEWGIYDLEAIITFSKNSFSLARIMVLGHSIGGLLLGFARSAMDLDKVLLVGSQSGYCGFWKEFSKVKMWATWHIIFPVLTNLNFYFPSKSFTRMENLPKEVALQLSQWSRNPKYFLSEYAEDILYFKSILVQVTSISIEDDEFAPQQAVNWLTLRFSNAQVKRIHLAPAEFGLRIIGHFGIFEGKNRPKLWNLLLKEILE